MESETIGYIIYNIMVKSGKSFTIELTHSIRVQDHVV